MQPSNPCNPLTHATPFYLLPCVPLLPTAVRPRGRSSGETDGLDGRTDARQRRSSLPDDADGRQGHSAHARDEDYALNSWGESEIGNRDREKLTRGGAGRSGASVASAGRCRMSLL